MTIQHKELAGGRWAAMTVCAQMANIGSEVSRATNWQKKGKRDYCHKAAIRALELIDLSLVSARCFSYTRELTRLREAVVDCFFDKNTFCSSEVLWRHYFDPFAYAARG